ncbi:phospholipase DDHD1-like isoform X2 [Mizuhopecten yessoensis]|uniref:phospholipase DDHD1-like isoform X2 n=1 Tax=Mizuhopecten yessoensis TaxID=6573 RepID=UPI000B45F6AE|nr:phospholipase DDHD1-like isoform X2 [Mizuhopecten yessoensis]
MMRDLGVASPGDGINGSPSRHSSSRQGSSDRLYPSLFPSDDEDDMYYSKDSDSASGASVTSEARSTPPLVNRRRHLYPQNEFVNHLRPEEVRWFYKQVGDKEWRSFIGYDSLRIECRFRAMQNITEEEKTMFEKDIITVRGGLYEVDVDMKKCTPIYWSDDVAEMRRGLWFYDDYWQPVEDEYAQEIESVHIAKYMGHKLNQPPQSKGRKQVVQRKNFPEFYIDWNSVDEIFLFSESASSKIFRSVSNKIGIAKSGRRLRRGYRYEAVMDDKPPDISHLLFVIHGIGQKMETGNIINRCQDLRNQVKILKQKLFPNFNELNQRAEFLPVEWRTRLKLDGDTVDSITPHKLRGIRTVLNSSAMDILYYTSPLYRSEITHSLQTELNRLHEMFCKRNPYFLANGGKVSIIAHSLGSVITYDIITGWNPIQMYDQFVTSVIDNEEQTAGSSAEIRDELKEAKRRINDEKDNLTLVNDLESLLMTVHEKQKTETTLNFQLENLFCLGSPLAVFLALRGIRPKGKGTLDHILPSSACKRLYNIYHPYDPVAYRLEPLILKHYSTIAPLCIHKHDAGNKQPYGQMKTEAYAAFQASSESERGDQSDREFVDSTELASNSSQDTSPSRNQVTGIFTKKNEVSLAAELKSIKRLEKDAAAIEKSLNSEMMEEDIDQTDLEYRIDFQLREGGFVSSYLSLLTSHTSYWKDSDVAYFLLTHLHPALEHS